MIVFKVTNRVNGKIYIGLTTQSIKRTQSKYQNFSKGDINTPFFTALRNYGALNFVWEVLGKYTTTAEMYAGREYYITFYNSTKQKFGYNCETGGLRFAFIDSTKQKMSDNHWDNRGKNHPMHGIHRYGKDAPNYGNKHTEDSKEKNRQAHLGKKASEDTRQKLSDNNARHWRGKTFSDEHKEKMRQSQLMWWERKRGEMVI